MTMGMTVVLLFGAAIGLSLGLARFKVFALLPVILFLAAGAIGSGLADGLEFRFIALAVLVAVVSPQIAYLASFLAAGYATSGAYRRKSGNSVPLLWPTLFRGPFKSLWISRPRKNNIEGDRMPMPQTAPASSGTKSAPPLQPINAPAIQPAPPPPSRAPVFGPAAEKSRTA